MHVFHNIECSALRGAPCNCLNRTEYDPPAHYTNIDDFTLLMYEEAFGIYRDVYDEIMRTRRPCQLQPFSSGGGDDFRRMVQRRVSDILEEMQIESGQLRPFVEGEPIGMIRGPVQQKLCGLAQADYDKMMERVWAEHKLKTVKERRTKYSLTRRPRGLVFHIQWHPEEKMFYVRRRDS